MSLIEQAAKRLEQLRQAGVDIPEEDAPPASPLTAPVHGLPSVAGDELRKDGGNEAGPGLRADPTGKPKGGLRI